MLALLLNDDNLFIFFITLSTLMVYTTCPAYYKLYKKYKECNKNSCHNQIESLTRENPSIISSCKIWQNVGCGCGQNVLLSETKKAFEFTHCIDVTDLVDFESKICLLYTSPSPRDGLLSRMPSSA